MWKVALKGILGHKARVISTSLAVLLGVAFMAGTLIFTDTIQSAFDDLFADVNAGTDAVVRSNEVVEADFGFTVRQRIDASLVETIADIDGVADAQAETENPETYVIDADGDPIIPQAPAFGRVWSGTGPLSPWVLQGDSREPMSDDEVILDVATADKAGYALGDEVPVITPNVGLVTYDLVGIVKFGTQDGTLGATQVLFTLDEAQRVLGEAGMVDRIFVAADDGVDEDEIVRRIEAALADVGTTDIEVLTGSELTAEDQEDIGEALDFFRIGLIAFSIVAVVVGGFIIYNTFSILVAQRGRELALLRAIGASRRQVLASVLVEAAVVAVVASIIGLFAGVLLSGVIRSAMNAGGFGIPDTGTVLTTTTVVVSLVVGIAVTMLSAILPARRASRVAPLEAMRASAIDRSNASPLRIGLAATTFVVGNALVFAGLAGVGPLLVAVGALILLICVIVSGPVVARPVAGLLGAPIAATRGIVGRMARENVVRNPNRTATTALALTIGVTLVVFISIFAQSFKDSAKGIFEDQFTGDLVVESGSFGTAGFVPDLAASLRERDDVAGLTPIRFAPAQVADEQLFLQAVSGPDAVGIFDVGVVEGDLTALGDDGIAISTDKADETGWEVGTPLEVQFLNGDPVKVAVEVIYTEEQLANAMFVDVAVFDAAGIVPNLDSTIFVDLVGGADFDTAQAEIEAFVEDQYPQASISNLAEYVDSQLGFINQILGLIYGLLSFSCLLAGFGIANTLRLSIVERRREIGLTRAVGMTRAQVRSTFRWESIVIALFGTVGGMALGTFFGVIAVQALADDGFVLAVPGTTLGIIAIFAVALGIGAAWRPARKAAKLDILDAISSQ